MASYSGVSGAPWVVPQTLVGSKAGWPRGAPGGGERRPIHWPLRSGYFVSSKAQALSGAAQSIAASAAVPIAFRVSITILRQDRASVESGHFCLSKYLRLGGA